MPPLKNKRIVGVVKAARYAGVSRWTINAWTREGRLRWIRLPSKGGGYRTMIDLDDLDKFIERQKVLESA